MSFVSRRLALAVVVATALMAFLAIGQAGIAWAGVYDVTTQQDESDGACDAVGTGCSIREAVDAAELDPGSTVNVPAGTYVLTLGQIYVDEDMTITGAGARDTIVDGNDLNRVFKVRYSTVAISQLTVTNGLKENQNGGGIKSISSDLTLDHVAVTNNVADSDLYVFGGGISAEGYRQGPFATRGEEGPGSLTIRSSLIAGNTVGGEHTDLAAGGGIHSQAVPIDLTNVTVSDNLAQHQAATPGPGTATQGPEGYSYGGGIAHALYLNGTTVTEPIEPIEPSSTLLNLTVSNNTAGEGGGIHSYTAWDLAFKNTIVADNVETGNPLIVDLGHERATDGTDNCNFLQGLPVSNGHNLESDTSCGFTAGGDRQNADPKLGALQNNTGQTDTRELLEGSPALDTADNTGCPGTDQRDVTRPQKDICDIGAYEKIYTPPAPVTPAGAVAAAKVKAAATAKISGPRGCVRKSATIRVRGKGISSVTYSLDGKRIKRAKGDSTSVTIRSLKSGAHRVTARITFTSATAAKPVTKRFSIVRCAKAKPKFTG
ncbi:MAG: choice-of-anchor Q domain-containing protein [Solirubrobacterales bacterium]